MVVCNSAGLEFCVGEDDLGLLISCSYPYPVLGQGRVTDTGHHAQLLLRFYSGFLGFCKDRISGGVREISYVTVFLSRKF